MTIMTDVFIILMLTLAKARLYALVVSPLTTWFLVVFQFGFFCDVSFDYCDFLSLLKGTLSEIICNVLCVSKNNAHHISLTFRSVFFCVCYF